MKFSNQFNWSPNRGLFYLLQFMAITYVLNIVWILMFCFLCIVTFVYTIFWKMCSQPIEEQPRRCQIDLAQFRKYLSEYYSNQNYHNFSFSKTT